jgi:hypothetical protein
MLLIVGLGLMINSMWAKAGVLGSESDFSHAALLTETNTQRANAQLAGLTIDPQLTSAAQAKAEDMVAKDYWSHNSPDGKTPWTFIAASGYKYITAGENLAYGFNNASEAINGWMNSPTHRDNILSTNYSNVGFGVASSPNFQGEGPKIIVVAEYGQPVAAAATITFTVPETAQNTPAQAPTPAVEVPPEVEVPVVKAATDKQEIKAQPVSRIQVLTGGDAAWATMAVGALAGAAFTLFLTRHGLRLHKVLVRGEAFIAHHPMLDITIVIVFTAGFILTRASGVIR